MFSVPPSFWLLSGWRHVETQNISQVSKKKSPFGLYMVPEQYCDSLGRWPRGIYHHQKLGWVKFSDPVFFALFVTCLAEKIGFACTNTACKKKMNAHRFPICISLCAEWVCSSGLQPKLPCSSQSDGKIVVACTNTSCHKMTNAHRNPIETLMAFNRLQIRCPRHGGATTTGPDATYPPAICQNSGGGGGGVGGVRLGVGGGPTRGLGGGSCRGSGAGSGRGSGGRRMG